MTISRETVTVRPCPKCGSEAQSQLETTSDTPYTRRLVCPECGAATGWRKTEADAVRDWQRGEVFGVDAGKAL